jgi:hypothetical protein
MKRSEALEKIAKILYDQAKRLDEADFMALTEFVDSKEEWVADAEEVLSAMEGLGMKPPGREEDLLTFKTMDGEIKGYDYSRYVWDEDVADEPDTRAFWDEDVKKSGAW